MKVASIALSTLLASGCLYASQISISGTQSQPLNIESNNTLFRSNFDSFPKTIKLLKVNIPASLKENLTTGSRRYETMDRPADKMYQLSALLDNELNDTEAEEVKRKITWSEKWRRNYEELKAISELLNCWDRYELKNLRASETFELRLAERIKNLKQYPVIPFTILIFPPCLHIF